jgi:hypothetical protein
MFEPMFDNLRKATEMTIQIQQEMLKKWTTLLPNSPSPAGWSEQVQRMQKKWVEIIEETLKKQREVLESQCNAGLKGLESAFDLADIKDYSQLRGKTTELWQKSFDSLRQAFEGQLHSYQFAMGKWMELMTKGAA